MDELISVVIPCYNDGAYLSETFEKLKEQTYSHVEIIIVNDGSTDEYTLQLLQKLSAEKNVRVIHKPNGKLPAARNTGIREAKGNIIVTWDADDYFEKTFFEKGIKILRENKDVGSVISYSKNYDGADKKFRPRGGGVTNMLFSNEGMASVMMRKECWEKTGGYDETMTLGLEDWDFNIRMTSLGYVVHVIPEYLFYYRVTQKSMLQNVTKPNFEKIIRFMMEKNYNIYLEYLPKLIASGKVLNSEMRVSWQNIFSMIRYRLKKKRIISIFIKHSI